MAAVVVVGLILGVIALGALVLSLGNGPMPGEERWSSARQRGPRADVPFQFVRDDRRRDDHNRGASAS